METPVLSHISNFWVTATIQNVTLDFGLSGMTGTLGHSESIMRDHPLLGHSDRLDALVLLVVE
jgi:hypothetical protein